jgi:hypothetical protein
MQPTTSRLFDRLLEAVTRCLSDDAASALAGLRADQETQAHVAELAEKCNEATISDAECAEYKSYVMAAGIVAILQAKARARLHNGC